MRTRVPPLLPIFRSEMQVRLLALMLLQPERSWTLKGLAQALDAPQSSVHRELGRAEAAGVIRRDGAARPYRFSAATDDAAYEPLADLLRRSVGVEGELRASLDRPDVHAAVIYGSWASGARRPDSDIDVLVVGDANLRELRRLVRPIGAATGRTVDLTLLADDEFRRLVAERSSFVRQLMEAPVTSLVGDLGRIANQ
jgi:predicted nucleotidyltransferase